MFSLIFSYCILFSFLKCLCHFVSLSLPLFLLMTYNSRVKQSDKTRQITLVLLQDCGLHPYSSTSSSSPCSSSSAISSSTNNSAQTSQSKTWTLDIPIVTKAKAAVNQLICVPLIKGPIGFTSILVNISAVANRS